MTRGRQERHAVDELVMWFEALNLKWWINTCRVKRIKLRINAQYMR